MGSNAVDRRQASRVTLISQVAAAVFVLGAAAVLAVGLPGQEPARAPGDLTLGPLPAPAQNNGNGAEGTRLVDAPAVAARLGTFSNAPRPRVVEAPVATTQNTTTAAPPVAPSAEVKYLGSVAVGPRLVALVLDNAKQRMVAEGDRVSMGVVRGIEPELIRVETDTEMKEIRRAERTAAATGRGNEGAVMPMSASQAGRNAPNAQRFANQAQPALQPKGGADAQRLRRQFITDMRDKLKSSGQYATEEELNEALAKTVEQAGYQFEEGDKKQ